DNLVWLYDMSYDSIKHEQYLKKYGEQQDGYETMTDIEANQLAASMQSKVKTNFAGKTFSRDGYITVSK
ncbi:MAG: hypothetical protein J5598_02485, partial [Clostridia bacterium]|nr:hypothetical protein [Clostridia bacterium]